MGTAERSTEITLCRVCFRSFTPAPDDGGVCPDCSPNRTMVKQRRRNFASAGVDAKLDRPAQPSVLKSAAASIPYPRLWVAAAGVAAIAAAASVLAGSRPIRHPPGILVAEQPLQEKLEEPKAWQKEGYEITALAAFRIRARVLSKARYWLGREAELSSYDLALGWGQMSDQVVIDQMKIWQEHRWYKYSYSYPPLAQGTIQTHSANMHIIPATRDVEKRLGRVVPGHLVEITGYLVLVTAADGWRWRSSLSRGDSGGSSCEVIWAEDLFILP